VGDCYLNGPSLREEEKLLALACSIVAVLLNEQYAFILAEIAWFIVFARSGIDGLTPPAAKVTTTTVAVKSVVTEEKNQNACPEPMKKAIQESLEAFKKNREGDITSDGQTWELVKEENGDKIWRAKLPGQSIYRWRAQSTLYGPRSGVLSELFDYSKRAGPQGWDPNLAKGRVHKEYDGNYKILIYSSNPVMGGLISPREFVEGRLVLDKEPNGVYMLSGIGLDEKTWAPILKADYPARDKNCTAAKAFPGGGFFMAPVQPGLDPETPQEWNYQLVVCTEIGGWLPTSTINAATAQVMQEATQMQKAHTIKKFK
jgi:hypothetical protein